MDVPSLEQISNYTDFPDLVNVEMAEFRAFWGSHNPELDLEPGVAHDLVILPAAEASALARERIDYLNLTRSLAELVADPVLDTPEQVDWILQNYPGYSRRLAGAAKGIVVIVRATDQIVSVPRGSTFSFNGLTYSTSRTYVGTPYLSDPAAQRKITARADGTFSFAIPVTATQGGSQYNIKANTPLIWNANVNHVRAYAESDFYDGTDAETTEEIAARMDETVSLPAMGGRMNIAALLRRQFEGAVRDVSMIGGWDPEMQRDGYNPFGIKTGGRADIYVKTADTIIERTLEFKGTLLDPATSMVQVYIGRDVFPGFYTVQAVRRSTDAPDAPALDVDDLFFGADTTGFDYDVPVMRSNVDSRYSRYQTATIRFVDAGYTPDSIYKVTFWGVPLIAEIQDFLADRTIRKPNGDVLVKAAIPYIVAVNVTMEYLPGASDIDITAAREATLRAISSATFRDGKLLTTTISTAVEKTLPVNTKVLPPVDMLGVLYPPDAEMRSTRSTLSLVVENDYPQCVSPRTVAFYPYDANMHTARATGPHV